MSAHPTRLRLLAAAGELLESHVLSTVSVDEIVKRAGVAKGTFYVHFGDRRAFAVALFEQFHDGALHAVGEAVSESTPGVERLGTGAEAYLDYCLGCRAVRSSLDASRTDPELATTIARHDDEFAALCATDVATLGFEHPELAARLFISMLGAVALLEQEAAAARPDARATVRAWLRTRPTTPPPTRGRP